MEKNNAEDIARPVAAVGAAPRSKYVPERLLFAAVDRPAGCVCTT